MKHIDSSADDSGLNPSPVPGPQRLVRATGWARIDWRTDRIVLALALAEVAIAWLIVNLLAGPTLIGEERRVAIPILALAFLWLGASLLPRLLASLVVLSPMFELLTLAGIIGTGLALIKTSAFPTWSWFDSGWLTESLAALIFRPSAADVPIWALVIVIAVAWWWGRRRADPSLDVAFVTLRLGTPILAFAVIGQSLVGDLGERAVIAAIGGFYAATLAAIGFARAQAYDLPRERRHLARATVSTVIATALVLVVAALLAGILSQELLATVMSVLGPFIWLLRVILEIAVWITAFLAVIIFWPILWLLSLREVTEPETETQPIGEPGPLAFETMMERTLSLPDPIRYLLALALLALIFGALTRFAIRRRGAREVMFTEERERDLNLRGFLADIARRLTRRLPGRDDPVDPLASLRGDPRWAYTVTIRELYAQFLAWSAEIGPARRLGETPARHADRFAETHPSTQADLMTLSETYQPARYGALPASADAADRARAAWRRIEDEVMEA